MLKRSLRKRRKSYVQRANFTIITFRFNFFEIKFFLVKINARTRNKLVIE